MSRQSENVKAWRRRIKEFIVYAMGGCCQICKYDKCSNALELHHIDPSKKELSFGKIRANPVAIIKIANELKKCILLCSNCHKEIHSGIVCLPVSYSEFNNEKFEELHTIVIQKNKEGKESKIKLLRLRPSKISLSDEELINLLKSRFNGNKSALARELKVSETIVRKRVKRYLTTK